MERNCSTPPEPLTDQVRDHKSIAIRNKIRNYTKPGKSEKRPAGLELEDTLESNKEEFVHETANKETIP